MSMYRCLNVITPLNLSLSKKDLTILLERLINKFIENDYEKIERLVELHIKYIIKVRSFEEDLMKEGIDIDDEDTYLDRLDAGLFTLQLIDLILAFTCYFASKLLSNTLLKERIKELLDQKNRSLDEIKSTLQGIFIFIFVLNY
jgi:beta-catenin-like protein 1